MKHRVERLQLDNGAQGLLIHIPDATVMSFDLNFRAGEYLSERSKWETAHLMEHILLGANELIPSANAFHAEFEKNGAYNNASTSSYDISYEAECADFEWDRILGLLLTAISKPLFLRSEFDAEYGNVREELTARSNNHFRHLGLATREKFGFLAVTDQERLTLMENVKLQDVIDHYKATHNSSNLRFVIAGKLTKPRKNAIQKLLGNIELPQGSGRTSLPDEVPKTYNKPLCIENDTIENIYFYIDTFRIGKLDDKEHDNLSLINSMLTETLYSMILGTAREKGLVYSMSSGISQSKNTANWWFGAQISPKNAPQLFDIIVEKLNDVFSGNITVADINAAKQYALGKYQRSGQTVGGTANGYAYRYFFDDAVEDYYLIPERIAAITQEGIVEVAKSMFVDQVWGLGILGNVSTKFLDDLNSRISPLWGKNS